MKFTMERSLSSQYPYSNQISQELYASTGFSYGEQSYTTPTVLPFRLSHCDSSFDNFEEHGHEYVELPCSDVYGGAVEQVPCSEPVDDPFTTHSELVDIPLVEAPQEYPFEYAEEEPGPPRAVFAYTSDDTLEIQLTGRIETPFAFESAGICKEDSSNYDTSNYDDTGIYKEDSSNDDEEPASVQNSSSSDEEGDPNENVNLADLMKTEQDQCDAKKTKNTSSRKNLQKPTKRPLPKSSKSKIAELTISKPTIKKVRSDSDIGTHSSTTKGRVCHRCKTSSTPKWRKSKMVGSTGGQVLLCNACGLQNIKAAIKLQRQQGGLAPKKRSSAKVVTKVL